jgi:hypothetical protein
MAKRGRRAWPALLALLTVAAMLLSSLRAPAWWVERPAVGAEIEARAGHFEQACVSELHRIRNSGERWAVRIREADVNEWLATRLDAWCRHAEIEPIGPTQVRFVKDRAFVAVRRAGLPSVAVVSLSPKVFDEQLEPGLGVVRLGRLPIPLLLSLGLGTMIESLGGGDADDLRAVLVPLLQGQGIDSSFELVDGRRVRLTDLEVREGELLLQFETRAASPK